MQCPNCEAENRDDANFCDECGFPLSGSIARVARGASTRRTTPLDENHDPLPDWTTLDETPSDRARVAELDSQDAEEDEFDAFEDIEQLEEQPLDDSRDESEVTEPEQPAEVLPAPAPANRYEPADDLADFDPFEPDRDVPYGHGGYIDESEREELFKTASWQGAADATQSFAPQREAQEPQGSAQGSVSQEAQPASGEGATVRGDWPAEYTMEMPRVDQDRPAQGRDFRLSSSLPQHRKAKLAAFIIAGIAVGAIVAALVTYALGFWGGISVPDVTGMPEEEARTALTAEGFTVRTTQVKSDDTEGLVLIMDPGAGSRAPEGSEVVIHISTTRFIPDIVGKNADEAKALLEEAGYENVRYEMQKSNDEENVVLEVSPEEGTRAKSNAEITVKVSEAYRVPEIDGLDAYSALGVMSEAGLSPEIVYIDTDQFPDGSIIGTNPEPGTKVSEGDYVSISVARARGVELVGLTENLLAQGNTVTIGGVDYEIESLVSVSYQGDDAVAYTLNGRPKITFFGETLYASSSQTVSGVVTWSDSNEVTSIS